ncbi:hypothetical protein OU426_18115, partial [Frigidibacter sp. RF13]
MRRVRKILAWVLAAVVGLPALAVGAILCWFWWNTFTAAWHQRLTLTVDTPRGEVRGEVVYAVRLMLIPKILPDAGRGGYDLRGEALVMETAPGRWLFALLKGGGELNLGVAANGGPSDIVQASEEAAALVLALPKDQPQTVARGQYPLLVTFDDIADPKTVRRVDPDDMDATFGCDRGLTAAEAPWRAEGRTWA